MHISAVTIYFVCFVGGGQTVSFCEVVFEVMRHLEGAYALIFKSWHYPNELIACKLGSPLLLGVKVSNSLPPESRSCFILLDQIGAEHFFLASM